jgi:hypothetical protein
MPLRVLTGKERPIVLCAVDWIGIANDCHSHFREELARAAGTTRERVAVHALHQHDAPTCHFTADALAEQHGIFRCSQPQCQQLAAGGHQRTPPAVVFLNSEFVLRQSDALAKRLLATHADETAMIRRAYQLLFAREPSSSELELGRRFLADAGPDAWTLYAQAPWDNHGDIMDHKRLAAQADPAIAFLVKDLQVCGLLEETLVIVGSEFGRTPAVPIQPNSQLQNGRDHSSLGFTILLAGAGIRGGTVYGATDDFGYKAVEQPVHVHDLHATVLHLLGLDHTRLTYPFSGRDFRLTDVHGNVINAILA